MVIWSKNKYSTQSELQKRIFIICSYLLGDEGSQWREHNKKGFTEIQKLYGNWAAKRKTGIQSALWYPKLLFLNYIRLFGILLLINSKNYVRLVNGALIEDIHKPISSYSSQYNAYINVLSFELYEQSLDKGSLVFKKKLIPHVNSLR